LGEPPMVHGALLVWAQLLLAERPMAVACLERPIYHFAARALASSCGRLGRPIPQLCDLLLLHEPVYFEFRSFPAWVVTMLEQIPLERRGTLVDQFRTRSFAEPSETWFLYDLCPSIRRLQRLLKLMPEFPEFFAGAGAHQAMRVCTAFGEEGMPLLIQEASRRRSASYRKVLIAAVASLSGYRATAELERFAKDKAPEPRAILAWLKEGRGPFSEAFLEQNGLHEGQDGYGGRPKGGVLGANGRPWDGTFPRYSASR
jgi:hypothetical protein